MVLNLNSIIRADTVQGLRTASQATVISAETLKIRAAPLAVSQVAPPAVSPVIASVVTGETLHIAVSAHDAPIAINQLDAAGLASAMKGVGPRKAEAIVEFRTANGPFMAIEELLNVSGIGERILQMNAGRLQL